MTILGLTLFQANRSKFVPQRVCGKEDLIFLDNFLICSVTDSVSGFGNPERNS